MPWKKRHQKRKKLQVKKQKIEIGPQNETGYFRTNEKYRSGGNRH